MPQSPASSCRPTARVGVRVRVRSTTRLGRLRLRAPVESDRRPTEPDKPPRCQREGCPSALQSRASRGYGEKATPLLTASKASLARTWVAFTLAYQELPPTFDWLAA